VTESVKRRMFLSVVALLALGPIKSADAQETVIPDHCKNKEGYALVSRSEDAVRIAYAFYVASAPTVRNPKYDEPGFMRNHYAYVAKCDWFVRERNQNGVQFFTISSMDGRLINEGLADYLPN
jgi:hypothetical protein